jgi:hypothetical protein
VNIEAMEARIRSIFAVPTHQFYVGEIDVPCGPGRFCARIEYDEGGPVLTSRYRREEFALAMEERVPGMDLSVDAREAVLRRMACYR